MIESSPTGDIRELIETFEALARRLEVLLAENNQDADTAARLESVRSLAFRGSAILRRHMSE